MRPGLVAIEGRRRAVMVVLCMAVALLCAAAFPPGAGCATGRDACSCGESMRALSDESSCCCRHEVGAAYTASAPPLLVMLPVALVTRTNGHAVSARAPRSAAPLSPRFLLLSPDVPPPEARG